MYCPNCGKKTHVTNSRCKKQGDHGYRGAFRAEVIVGEQFDPWRWRQRACEHCGSKLETVEVPLEQLYAITNR